MQRVLHGAERSLGVVGAVQVVAGAEFENGAFFWHRCFLQAMSRLTTTQALAIIVLSVPASLRISRPPSTTVTEPLPYGNTASTSALSTVSGRGTPMWTSTIIASSG